MTSTGYDMNYYRLEPDGTITAHTDPRMWQPIEERRVARETVIEGVDVSTVFLCLDHGWVEDGPPVLFESMIFGGEYDQFCERYCTLDEARAGHARIVAAIRYGRDPGGES